jgi:sugar phosphate isomerase/epimerase
LWEAGREAELYISELIQEVKLANEYNIKTVIMHITGGDTPPQKNYKGVKNIEKVLDYCENYGITLCLENLRRLDYLIYVYEKIQNTNLKFCFDTGHANAMTKNIKEFPWDTFGDRLYYLHLNDNNGAKDEHLIPFQGNIDWDGIAMIIKKYCKDIGLTLEVRSNDGIRKVYNEYEYLKMCYNSLLRLENIIEEK